MIVQALSGLNLLVATQDDAASVCVRHLERLGALIVEEGRRDIDVVLADDASATERDVPAAGMLTCVFESIASPGEGWSVRR